MKPSLSNHQFTLMLSEEQWLQARVFMVVQCIQQERVRDRLDGTWKLDGLSAVVRWLDMEDEVFEMLGS